MAERGSFGVAGFSSAAVSVTRESSAEGSPATCTMSQDPSADIRGNQELVPARGSSRPSRAHSAIASSCVMPPSLCLRSRVLPTDTHLPRNRHIYVLTSDLAGASFVGVAPTKQLGTWAELAIAADLARCGYSVLFPVGEDCNFDLAIEREGSARAGAGQVLPVAERRHPSALCVSFPHQRGRSSDEALHRRDDRMAGGFRRNDTTMLLHPVGGTRCRRRSRFIYASSLRQTTR